MTAARTVGDSGIEVSPLALGGNVFGWTADEPTSFRVLDAFVDAGGRMIDTADVYSNWVAGHSGGESESMIGRWLRRDPAKRGKIVIATKVGYLDGGMVDGEFVADLRPSIVARAVEDSLRRLGVETIDLYYQHKDDPRVPLADSLGAFDALRRSGKIGAIGLSNFTAGRVEEALKVSSVYGFAKPAALQNWYNLIDRGHFEGALQQVAVEHGLSQFPYYSLANGFLSGKYRSERDFAKSVRGERARKLLTSERGRCILEALDDIARETGAPLVSIALAWLKAQPCVTAPIASATSVEQLSEIVQALTLKLDAGQLERLTEAGR